MNTENIQTENRGFKYFLKSNLKVISIFVFIIIFLGVGFLYSDYSDEKRRIKSSENYIEAKILITQEKTKRASEILKKNIENRDKTYSPLSLFLIIDQDLEKDKKIIKDYFDTILSIRGIDKEDLNLIRLKKAIFISNMSEENDMLELLNPIINSDSVWKTQSIKFLGDYYFSYKQFKKAEQYYLILLESEDENIDKNEIKMKINLIKNA